MASMVVLTGRFGTDPEAFSGDKGARASFRFASTEWEQGEEHTDWYSVSCFGRLAERMINQGAKGKKATLWGRLRLRKYTTPKGEERMHASLLITSSGLKRRALRYLHQRAKRQRPRSVR